MIVAVKQTDYPTVIDKTEAEIAYIISLINSCALPDDIKMFIISCIQLAMWFPRFLAKKKISLHRLRVIIFGKGYRSNNDKNKQTTNASTDKTTGEPDNIGNNIKNNPNQVTTIDPSAIVPRADPALVATDVTPEVNNKKPGHGRMPHTVYKNCIEVTFALNLKVGDACPILCGGKLGNYSEGPGILVRVIGRGIADVYRYTVEKLRCNLCLEVIAAEAPPEIVNAPKYDAAFKAIIVLQKYYLGMPFYRQEHFQSMLGFPLPDATQWDLCEEVAGSCIPVFNVLRQCAANGTLAHNDDTTLRILDVIKQIKNGTAGNRTGMYTTGIIANYEKHQIALFLNGRKHSGENMADLLALRDPILPAIIQMCDALSHNVPKGLQTILCNCLSHGFRKFDELIDYFQSECIIIMQKLGRAFDFDDDTRSMNAEERLAYHQEYSKPVMDELYQYMTALMDEHKVEPNSELGGAIKYMLRHWTKLTRFLTVAGAPIDNNIVERALKVAIRNRKAAFFYRTEYSANIGGVLTSVIYTCHLAGQNPQHYLTALQIHKAAVIVNPKLFLPWNYKDTVAALAVDANSQAHVPPEADLAAA